HGGWHATMPQPHLIIWTSPLGHTYQARLPKIITPLPGPHPRQWPHVCTPTAGEDLGADLASMPLPPAPESTSTDPHGTETPATRSTVSGAAATQTNSTNADDDPSSLGYEHEIPPF
ncbi:hypothetical protein, partial [Microbispora sp. NPDC049125]|uniref:hypothetical protein n=1 Tax=Microbispora sp. NPDC049125 TaxID=3154929 RepID=UPI00346735D2